MNCLLNTQIKQHLPKFKAYASDNSNLMQTMEFDRKENIARKGENAGYQHLLLFLNVYKAFLINF